jgi:hypothetical protein
MEDKVTVTRAGQSGECANNRTCEAAPSTIHFEMVKGTFRLRHTAEWVLLQTAKSQVQPAGAALSYGGRQRLK